MFTWYLVLGPVCENFQRDCSASWIICEPTHRHHHHSSLYILLYSSTSSSISIHTLQHMFCVPWVLRWLLVRVLACSLASSFLVRCVYCLTLVRFDLVCSHLPTLALTRTHTHTCLISCCVVFYEISSVAGEEPRDLLHIIQIHPTHPYAQIWWVKLEKPKWQQKQ